MLKLGGEREDGGGGVLQLGSKQYRGRSQGEPLINECKPLNWLKSGCLAAGTEDVNEWLCRSGRLSVQQGDDCVKYIFGLCMQICQTKRP